MNKWYVLYVNTSTEYNVKKVINRDISKCEAKVFNEEIIERKQGINRIVNKLLYPGYVFVNCELTEEIYYKLVTIPGVIKILGTRNIGGGAATPVPEKEMNEILGYIDKNELIKISEAIIIDGKIKILSGPLLGKERFILKLDKRKGRVKVHTRLFDTAKPVYFGITIKEP